MPNTRITDYPAMSVMAENDVMLGVDVSDTTESSSGTTKKIPWSVLLSMKTANFIIAHESQGIRADYYLDGVADEVQINAAIQALPSTGGKIVVVAARVVQADKILLNKTKTTFEGLGIDSTVFTLANNDGGGANVMELKGTGTVQCKLRNFTIDGNKSHQLYGDGLYIDTPWTGDTSDTNHSFSDIKIQNCKNNGIEIPGNSDNRVFFFQRVHTRLNDGNGFYMAQPANTDSIFESCVSDTNANNGFVVGCVNSHFINCKAFFNGSAGGNYHGFYVGMYNNYFENCEAQDNYQSGFYSQNDGPAPYGSQFCTFVNCIADSNGINGGSTYACGFQFKNVKGFQVIGGLSMTRPYPSQSQRLGISLEGTTTGCRIIGLDGESNTSALYSDTSSGVNYPMGIPGVTSVFQDGLQILGNADIAGSGKTLGFYGGTKVARRAGAAQAAVATTAASNSSPYGFTTQAQADAIVTLLNEVRASLVALNLIKGSA